MKKMRRWMTMALASAIMLNACTPKETKQTTTPEYEVSSELEVVDDAYHFYVIGDWGRKGQFGQQEVADMMNKAGYLVEPEFIASTGDNIYPNGVASIHDPNWEDSFEDVYNGFFLNCPWYVVLGNHDYRGNAQAQIDYSQISQRWHMPDRYFAHIKGEDDDEPKLLMVYIDTNPFNLEYYEETKYKDKIAGQDTIGQKILSLYLVSS
jgi:hypothetical protein